MTIDSSGKDIARRQVLQAASVGTAALVVTGLLRPLLARAEGTPVSGGSVPPLIQAWVDAQNAMDAVAHAALYAADAILEDVPNHSKVEGANIPSFLQSVLGGMSDLHVELMAAFATADWGAAEYQFSVTNTGLIPVPTAIGKPYSVRATTIFQFTGDRIQRSSDYYDLATVLQQLGLAGPGSGGAPANGTPVS